MAEIPASELQREGQQDIFKLMDHRAPYDFGADALLSDGAYYPNAVKDVDGNWYDAVILGNQVWMAQNLRTTHFADGTEIEEGVTLSSSVPYYKNLSQLPGNVLFDKKKYGLHYNWAAVMNGETQNNNVPSGVQGIAPTGWHVPSKAEVDELVAYLNTQKRYFTGDADNNNGHLAKALAATYGWQTQSVAKAPGCNPDDNNVIGFNLPPAGLGLGYSYASSNQIYAHVYTCTERESGSAHILTVSNDASGSGVFVMASSCDSTWMAPVRCLCDLSPAEFRRWYVTQYKSMQHLIQEKGVEVFVCTYNNSNSTMDKTPAEIYAAHQGEMEIICFENNVLHRLSSASLDDGTYFIKFDSILNPTNSAPSLAYVVYNGTNWVSGQYDLQKRLYNNGANQNIKTINGNLILGSGNIELGKGMITGSASSLSSSSAQVTLNQRDADLENGAFLMISFGVDMPAGGRINVANSVIINSDIMWKNATLPANVIKSGDTCLFWYSYSGGTNITFLLHNSRWAGLKTVNGQTLSGSGNIAISDILVCDYSSGMDKTPKEIYEAKTAGKTVICFSNSEVYYLSEISYTNNVYTIKFAAIINANGIPEARYIMYYNGAWTTGGKELQQRLIGSGTGQNIKTINGNNLIGNGNIVIPQGNWQISEATPDISIQGTSLPFFNDGHINIYHILHFVDGFETFYINAFVTVVGGIVRVAFDNSSNSKSVDVSTFRVYFGTNSSIDNLVTNRLLSPDLQTSDGWFVPAGETMEIEVTATNVLAIIKKNYGGSTMDEDIMYSQIPIDNDTY